MDNSDIGNLSLVIVTLALSNLVASIQLGLHNLRDNLTDTPKTPQAAHTDILLNNDGSLALILCLLRYIFGVSSAVLLLHWIPTDRAHWGMIMVLVIGLGFALFNLPRMFLASTTLPERFVIRTTPVLRILSRIPIPESVSKRRVIETILGQDIFSSAKGAIDQRIVIPVDQEVNPPDEGDLRMIQAILRMENTAAREIMVPRVDVIALEYDQTPSQAATKLAESGHSRVPVYRDTIDTILGVLYARDLLSVMADDSLRTDISGLLRPVHFIPETQRVDELLTEFLAEQRQMAIVVDEYGGTAGIVTLEDILEEIVGEIASEFSPEEPALQVINSHETILEARADIEYLTNYFGVTVEADGFDTVGGFVYRLLGRVPSPGDRVHYQNLDLEVLTTLGKRIKKVRVTRSDTSPS